MPLFKDSFDTHIIEELNYRKSFNALQTALVPHVKVTSLVETEGSWEISGGNQTYQRLKGFTLGITDVNNINSLSSYFNNSGNLVATTNLATDSSKNLKSGTDADVLKETLLNNIDIKSNFFGGKYYIKKNVKN